MRFLRKLFYFFTPYTDADERAVGRFFKGLDEHGDQSKARLRLDRLLQRNIAVINLWTEYRYKGYRYLKKSQRRKLYANLQLIADDFDRYYTHVKAAHSAEEDVAGLRRVVPHAAADPQKAQLLQTLIAYFSPGSGKYEYRESSSFGRLLRDPSSERLVGDCNQIVTLYIYLYSRYYSVHDLQVRSLPRHVALHYGGFDIETTNGTIVDYSHKEGSRLLPVEEIVSINLLDTTDTYISTHEVAAKDFLQASRLAFVLSHDHDITAHNLEVAYSRLVNVLMQRHNYGQALKFAIASQKMHLLNIVGHNGAIYEINRHNYAAARRFAQHAAEKDALIRNSWQAEGAYHYQAHRYHDAIKAFKHIGDQARVRQCYEALFFEEQKKLGTTMTTETIKEHASTIKRMYTYANKSGNKKLIDHAGDLQKHL